VRAYHRSVTVDTAARKEIVERARQLDATDPLADARTRFVLPSHPGFTAPGAARAEARTDTPDEVVYLAGNSLGPPASGVAQRVAEAIGSQWGQLLARAWTTCRWLELPVRIGDRIASLIGARPGEVLVADTTSVALAKLVGAALAAAPGKRIVVSTADNFPSDLYAAMGAAQLAGARLEVVERGELEAALRDLESRVAVCCVTQVDFRTGALYDVGRITRSAHEAGALMLWDLCHSAGAVPVGCAEHDIDLAVGCTYKYLNGGPGSPSFIYVRRDLQPELSNPIPGWLGHRSPFDFDLDWQPAHGVRRFLTSSPPVLALAALDAALDAFDGISIEAIREKSKRLGQLFVDVIESEPVPGLTLASPRNADERGSQVSLSHLRATELSTAVAERGVIGDVRPPDICRFGMSPLTLSHEQVVRAATTITTVARDLAVTGDR